MNNLEILVILQNPKVDDKDTLHALEQSFVTILSFVDSDVERKFSAICGENGASSVNIIHASKYIREASLRARDKYSSFIAQWPEKFRKNGKNFKEIFTYKNEISLWWLSSASMKDNEVRQTFDYLCDIEIIKSVLEQRSFEKCVVFADDFTFVSLVQQLCQKQGIEFFESPPKPKRLRQKPAIWYLLVRVWFLILLIAKFIIFKLKVIPSVSDIGDDNKALVAFLSIYPSVLRNKDEVPYERNYRELPAYLNTMSDFKSVLVCRYDNRSVFNKGEIHDIRQMMEGEPKLLFLESYLKLSDILFVLLNLVFFFKYLFLDQFDKQFKASFDYDGINVYELIGNEFKELFLKNEIPGNLLIIRTMQRLAKDIDINLFVSFLELYPISRAFYYALKKSNPSTVTIAYQHANITQMKLWYTYQPEELSHITDGKYIKSMPIPHYYTFQGTTGKNIVTSCGYPEERCFLIGSPRYDDLGEFIRSRLKEESTLPNQLDGLDLGERKIILVTPSLSETDAFELINVTLQVCSKRDDCFILIKPHPACPVGQMVSSLKQRYHFEKVAEVSDNIHSLITIADLLIVSYSTVGDEAIALGCPVISYAGIHPTMSSFLDIEAAPLVHSVEELAQALEMMLYNEEYRQHYIAQWDKLVEGTFYRLDGQAKERFTEMLLQLQKGKASQQT